jgi:hypothetical protein
MKEEDIKENLCFKCVRENCYDRCELDSPRVGVRVCANMIVDHAIKFNSKGDR